jgi:hypothetical protein
MSVGNELFCLGSVRSRKCKRRCLARLVCIVRTGPGRGLQPQCRASKKPAGNTCGTVSWRAHLAELDSLMGLGDEFSAGMKHAKAVRRCTRRHGIDNFCADVVDVRRRALGVHDGRRPSDTRTAGQQAAKWRACTQALSEVRPPKYLRGNVQVSVVAPRSNSEPSRAHTELFCWCRRHGAGPQGAASSISVRCRFSRSCMQRVCTLY